MKKFFKSMAKFLSLVLIDLIAYYSALLLANFTRTAIVPLFLKDIPTFFFTLEHTATMYWIPLVYVMFIIYHRLYFVRFPLWEEMKNLLKSLTLSFFLVFVIIYITGQFESVLRIFFILLWLFSLIVFPLFRLWGKRILFRLGLWRENVIILGSGKNAELTILGLKNEEHLGYKVIGLLDDNPEKIGKYIEVKGEKYKIYGEINNLSKFVDVLSIDTIFIASPYSTEDLKDVINKVYRYVKRVIIIPDMAGVSIFNSELHFLFMEKLFMIKVHNSLNSKGNIFLKRMFDLSVCLIGFLLTSPIFLIIYILVKLTSKGKAFYSHTRIGKDGKEFGALKFRTMYSDSQERLKEILATDPDAKKEWEENYKLKDDPRVTPLGKFLRKTSLDEIPQIFNIIKGDMSLVGPRPVISEEIESYYKEYRDYYYSVKPGLTGLWQVSGRSDTDYDFRVQTDVWYIQNWSLWLDFIIMFKTPIEVVRGKGAY